MMSSLSYQARLSAERAIYENRVNIHDLPEIYHYWSNRHLRPKLEGFGFSSPNEFLYRTLEGQMSGRAGPFRFLSVGAGNCDMEVGFAAQLRNSAGCDFIIECLDLNAAMLERGRANAISAGVGENCEFGVADLNSWEPVHQYAAVIANQSLHHLVNLEHTFDRIRRALLPGAPFAISDMIGRNGHRRWPEARAIVNEFWRRLPPSYRFNRALNRFEPCFEDWDCSVEGFEGIRSQDILPLLTQAFHFEVFYGFGNVIDPFIDRQFGHNFQADQLWVRRLIDEVHYRDDAEQRAGRISPAHMLAIVSTDAYACPRAFYPLHPRDAVRDPEQTGIESMNSETVCSYDAGDWSNRIPEELRALSEAFRFAQHKVESLERQMAERTSWALELDREVRTLRLELTVQGERLTLAELEVENRTAWALALERKWNERTQWALSLRDELAAERQAALQMVYLPPSLGRMYKIAKAIWHGLRRLRLVFRRRDAIEATLRQAAPDLSNIP